MPTASTTTRPASELLRPVLKNPELVKAQSPQQRDAFDTLFSGQSVSVNACAGSGKTFNSDRVTENWNGPVELIPFMRNLMDEQARKFAHLPNVNVVNFHSRGFRLVKAYNPNKRFKVDEKKCTLIAKALEIDNYRVVSDLVSKAKGEGVGLPDIDTTMEDVAAKYGIPFEIKNEDIIAGAEKVLAKSDKCKTDLDFGDQIRFPVLFGYTDKFSDDTLVVLDEVQDFTPLSWAFIKTCLVTPSSHVFMVGDPHRQALMQFAGASSDLFRVMSNYFNCESKPLTVNRRCAKAIVANAPSRGDMEALPNAPEGEVGTASIETILGEICDGLHREAAVISKTNIGVIRIGIKLLSLDIPVQMRAGKLDSLIVRYALSHASMDTRKVPVGELAPKLREAMVEIASEGADVSEMSDIVDVIEVLETYCLSKGMTKVAWERRRPVHPIQQALKILVGGNEGVTLLTGHTSKGLEWNTVFILPAKTKAPEQDWEIDQDNCVEHVMATRARLKLITLTES